MSIPETKYKIAVINLGSTSTKIAYYENAECVENTTVDHPVDMIRSFPTIWDQYDFRLGVVTETLAAFGVKPEDLDAIVSRGGHTAPIQGGTYLVNKAMLAQSASEQYGNHATDLGIKIAYALSRRGPFPLTVDPSTTDEFSTLAHYSGLPEITRPSRFHVLNHRAVARQYAKDIAKQYEALNLIGVHMGGGITVAAHSDGRLVDATAGILGDGPFSSNRAGALPLGDVVDLCFAEGATPASVRKRLNGDAGLIAYLGQSDVRTIEGRIDEGDAGAAEVLEAMCYQTAKNVGAMAAVLKGKVDAIYLTGGMAHSKRLTGWIRERVEFIAPVILYPGEFEMQALARGAYDALSGLIPLQQL